LLYDGIEITTGFRFLCLIMGRPHYISEENWQKMSWKERDYVGLLMERKYSKADIKRKLYITTDQ
jgi:PHD/YefM family antitoxin component YafN of YafNO toxin-antitoxin module